jgi:hypothetical protein
LIVRRGPGGTLPRVRPAPEPNTIQAPEIFRQLQQRLGIRGMHITPTLESTVMPVVVVEDIRQTSAVLQVPYAAWARVVVQDLGQTQVSLFNIAGSKRRMRIQQVFIDPEGTPAGVLNIGFGFGAGMAGSPQALKIGIPQHMAQFNEDLPSNDIRQTVQKTAAGRLIPYDQGAAGAATFFEQRVFSTDALSHERIPFCWQPPDSWIYPNSAVTFWFDGGSDAFDVSAFWYEERFQ